MESAVGWVAKVVLVRRSRAAAHNPSSRPACMCTKYTMLHTECCFVASLQQQRMVPGADLRTWQQNMPAGRMIGTVVACTCMNCTMLHMAYTDTQLTHRHVCVQGALLLTILLPRKKERSKTARSPGGLPGFGTSGG